MGLATIIENEAHFQTEIGSAGTKLVVVDFTATWWVQTGETFFS